MRSSTADRSDPLAAATRTLATKLAGASDPSHSTLSRLGDTAAAVQLASRVLPVGWRLVRRSPLISTLLILGLAWAAYNLRSSSPATRE
jgi:hypothetical protein